MPIYPINSTYVSGFYNNKNVNGVDDRVYSAEDMRQPYAAIFSDGVKPNDNGVLGNDLKVELVSGMQIRVTAGRGMFGGCFFWNKSAYNITLDTAASNDRYDCIVVKADDNDDVRLTTIYVKSLNRVPVVSDFVRSEMVKEYCLAYIKIPAFSANVVTENITDKRLDQNFCGVITGVYNQLDGAAIATQWEAAFNNWFSTIKDTFVANATLIHTYYNQIVSTTTNQKTFNIGIPQYNKNTDTLIVMIEGRTVVAGVDYTIEGNEYINLTIGLPVVGTKILFQVLKSVDGSQAQTVVSQVNTLINQMNVVNAKLEYTYICNGTNDNIQISNLVKTFLNAGTDYGTMKLNVIGTIGMTTPAQGTGVSGSPYAWFDFNIQSNRKVIVDFSSCGQIAPTITDGTYNVIFHSNNNMHVIGANVVVSNSATNTIIRISNTTNGIVIFENCRFYITAYKDSLIALRGTFNNCRGSVANVTENSYCFLPASNSVVKINGGEYYAYTGDSTKQSAIVGQSGADAVSILYGVSGPTLARTGFYQTNSVIQYAGGGIINCTDLISELTLTVVAGISNIRGTIAKSKTNVL